MVLAFDFSAARACSAQPTPPASRAHLAAVGLPTHLNRGARRRRRALDALMDLIAQDKKVKRGQLTFILVRGIGQAFVEN